MEKAAKSGYKGDSDIGRSESERRDYKTYQRHEEAILDLILKK